MSTEIEIRLIEILDEMNVQPFFKTISRKVVLVRLLAYIKYIKKDHPLQSEAISLINNLLTE